MAHFFNNLGDWFKKFFTNMGVWFKGLGASIAEYFKTMTLKKLEKLLLTVGALIILIISLIWNVYGDTVLKIYVAWLILGLCTGVAGGIFTLVGSHFNSFDIKPIGLVFIGVGSVLTLGNIFPYIYILINAKSMFASSISYSAGMIIVFLVFNVLSVISTIGGYVLQIYRKQHNLDD